MRLPSPWTPRLAADAGSPSERLAAAMAEDIIEGRLEAGARLPAHRDLAYRLHIGLGSVTQAYAMLERRGLVRSVKGRATFVAVSQTRRGPLIDLSRNAPPAAMSERLLARTLTALGRRIDADIFNDYPPSAGHDEYRRQMAHWFSGLGMDADPRRLLLTSGARHALSLAFSVACGPGGTLLTEAQTYPGALALARHLGCRLAGVAMDEQGVLPAALDRALAARGAGPAALYVTPTMQNPTTATMGRTRRAEIVAVCRARDVAIIEDDVYTLRADAALPPLAMLAPERTLYVNSLSKTLNPALRIGGLVAPESCYERAAAVQQATDLTVSPMSCAVMEQWLLDGSAATVSRAIGEESRRRLALTRSLLGDAMRQPAQDGYHVWLPMAAQAAQELADAALTSGIVLTPPSATAADADAQGAGIRLCLGAPPLADLRTALTAIAGLLQPES